MATDDDDDDYDDDDDDDAGMHSGTRSLITRPYRLQMAFSVHSRGIVENVPPNADTSRKINVVGVLVCASLPDAAPSYHQEFCW